jgi:hypothetical protein
MAVRSLQTHSRRILVSRRRPPPKPSIYAIPFNGAVVCTDRGQHPEAVIAEFADWHKWAADFEDMQDSGSGPDARWRQTPHEDLVSSRHTPAAPDTLRFFCRRCGRDVRLRAPNVMAAIDALREVGGNRKRLILDVSLL